LPFSLFSDAIYSNEPLRSRVIKALIRPDTLAKVAAKAASGGVLRIGAVNLDSGEFVQIDLGELAEAYELPECAQLRNEIYELYIDSVLASTAMPLMMPPVYIEGRMLVDGGVRRQLFLDPIPREPSSGSVHQADAVQGGVQKINVTVMVNAPETLNLSAFDHRDEAAPNLGSIGQRSVLTMIDSSLDNDLYRIRAGAVSGGTVTVVSMDDLPAEKLAECQEQNDGLFSGKYMHCLYGLGADLRAGTITPSVETVAP
jgi:predicted acylesterase/phospholipase RssA